MVDYGATEGAVREVTETVQQRRQAGVGTVQHALLSSKLRTSIPQVGREEWRAQREGKEEKRELLLNIIGLLQGGGCCTEKKAWPQKGIRKK